MLCPQCKATIVDTVTQCPFCGADIHSVRRYIQFGKISLITSLTGIACVVVILALLRTFQTAVFGFALFFTNVLMLLAVISIIFGSIAFIWKSRDILGLIGLALGAFLLIGLSLGVSLALSLRF